MLFQGANLHIEDVLELNEFVEHAQLHQERYGDGFFVFVSKHYGSLKKSHEKQHNEEEKEHQHQPLNHDCNSQIQTAIVLNIVPFSIENTNLFKGTTPNFYYQDKFSTFEKQRVFQPPKTT